jgi:hypothetical protein
MPPSSIVRRSKTRRIWTIPLFIFILVIAILLTIVTPGDVILQLVHKRQIADAIGVAVIYLTFLAVHLILYAVSLRRFVIAIKNIPRTHIPTEKFPRLVQRFIAVNWARSATIAWETRPRFVKGACEEEQEEAEQRKLRIAQRARQWLPWHRWRNDDEIKTIVPVSVATTTWGPIEHAGWSESPDGLVEYSEVILELPHLLEAKAVSLAPVEEELGQPDPRMVGLLQRPVSIGLRDYILHLISVGVLIPGDQAEDFLERYEQARFGMKALSTAEFDLLMDAFSAIISSMSLEPTKMYAALEEMSSDADRSTRYAGDSEDNQSLSSTLPRSTTSSIRASIRRRRQQPSLSPNPTSPPSPTSSVIIRPPSRSSSLSVSRLRL